MIDTNKIISLARECLGTKYGHQGRTVGVVMDCAGPLVHIFKSLDMKLYDPKGYSRMPHDGRLEKILDKQPHLQRVKTPELSAGDVVIFRVNSAPQHIAIYTDIDTIVHANFDTKRVTEQSFAPWRNQLKHVYRFVE